MSLGKFRVDITGQVFGKLTALEFVGKNVSGLYSWRCICSCGNYKIIPSTYLRSGNTTSCGCSRGEAMRMAQIISLQKPPANRKLYGESSKWDLFARYRKGAKDRDIEFTLTLEKFLHIVVQDCYYCGRKSYSINVHKNYYGEFIYTGIDRVDNSKGYITDNVVPCCKECNYAKRSMSHNEFISLCIMIAERFKHAI